MVVLTGLLYDLDLTLLDTSSLEAHRQARDWRRAKDGLRDCLVYDGLPKALGRLHGPHAHGIVTTSPRPYAELASSLHGLPPILVAYHDVVPRKPHPAPLLRAAELLGRCVGELAYVGDDASDVMAAKRAGMYAVAATWGAKDIDALKAAAPDVILNHPHDLTALNFGEC